MTGVLLKTDCCCEEPPVVQACCFPGGSCLNLLPEECLEQGGTPQGEELTCIQVECPSDCHLQMCLGYPQEIAASLSPDLRIICDNGEVCELTPHVSTLFRDQIPPSLCKWDGPNAGEAGNFDCAPTSCWRTELIRLEGNGIDEPFRWVLHLIIRHCPTGVFQGHVILIKNCVGLGDDPFGVYDTPDPFIGVPVRFTACGQPPDDIATMEGAMQVQ